MAAPIGRAAATAKIPCLSAREIVTPLPFRSFRPHQPSSRLVFGIFAALAEFERALIIERTKAGLGSARARGRNDGAPFKMTPAKLRLARVSMGKPETKVADLCAELGITRQTLYRFVGPKGELRSDGERLLTRRKYSPDPV